MQLSLHEDMFGDIPLSEKFSLARSLGFDGIDFRGDLLTRRVDAIRRMSERTGIRVGTVYGRLGIPLVSKTIDARSESVSTIKNRICDTNLVGAKQLIVVPIFGPPTISVGPDDGVRNIELSLLLVLLDELSEYADQYNVEIVLEPLNFNETHFLTSPSETSRLCALIRNGRVRTMVDFYHVDLNGQNLVDEIEGTLENLALIHLSNRNRTLPGPEGVDFATGIRCLQRISYDGFLGFECSGPFTPAELEASGNYVRNLLK